METGMDYKDKSLLEILTPLEFDEIANQVCQFDHNILFEGDICHRCGVKRLTDVILGQGQEKNKDLKPKIP